VALPLPTLALVALGAAALVAGAVALDRRLRARSLAAAVAERDRAAAELSRRLGELYSLQELTHVLSSSLQLDHVVTEVARYAMRFLDGAGAAVLLAPEEGAALRVVAADGTLAAQRGVAIKRDQGGLALEAITRERVELRTAPELNGVRLFGSAAARTAAVAPLKAHGVTTGAVVVADRVAGTFGMEDARLLSTLATHTAVALANARLFDLVRRGKEQWEATFDAISEGMALVDDAGSIRRANSAFADLVASDVAAVIGQHLTQTLFGEQSTLADLLQAARAGDHPAPVVRRSEMLRRVLRLAAAPVARAVDGASVVVVVEDITEQQALEAQLIQSEKMAAVGTLVSGVAHELNNPLTSIAGLSEFLLEQPPGAALDREHLKVINEQAERAGRIVRDLLTFARKGPAEFQPVDLGDIAQRTVQLMGYDLKRHGVTVETSLAPGVPAVLGDRYQLQQVVLNLVGNAAHAVSGLAADRPRRVRLTVAFDGARVSLEVTDTGPGLSTEVQAQMFSPFFTTKPPGEGTGLGLFISYGIATAHGGTLTARSRPGEGATLALSLPAAPSASPRSAAHAETAAAAPPPKPRRILVVDDDPTVRRVVAALFASDGHRVDAATSGTDALALAQRERYDLVIADRLAAAGGEPLPAALARVRAELHERLIISTSDVRRETDEQAAARGPRILKKPFDLKELRKAAEEVFSAGVEP
jgi:two-component system NtrC family sensor kinase